ncbi:hypothetical protein BI336_05300 [Listeria monocytogenes]|nr:hypothetical protein [Listeria monocytogenes]
MIDVYKFMLSDISFGDCNVEELINDYPSELLFTLIEYLLINEYIFIVSKEDDQGIDIIHIINSDFTAILDYSNIAVEFTAKGRKSYKNQELVKLLSSI